MAIVRTTKETNTSGTAPPGVKSQNTAAGDKTKSVVKSAAAPVARPTGGRAMTPGRSQIAVKQGNAGSFIRETQTELRRVVWPTREEVRSGTIVTIGLLVFFALYIFGLDALVELLFKALGLYPNSSNG